jgi:hypothetical protein
VCSRRANISEALERLRLSAAAPDRRRKAFFEKFGNRIGELIDVESCETCRPRRCAHLAATFRVAGQLNDRIG